MKNAALGSSMTPPTVDLAEQAKLALRRMAKSVTVITCRHEGVRYAVAATAADALSMDPPSMIVSVNRSASLHAPLSAGAGFCLNVLARPQEEIFSRSEEHPSGLPSTMRISDAGFCLQKKKQT